MFTVNEVASRLNVSRSTIYNAIESGSLPHHRFGKGRGTIRVSEEQLQDFLVTAKVEQCPAASRLRDIQYRGPTP